MNVWEGGGGQGAEEAFSRGMAKWEGTLQSSFLTLYCALSCSNLIKLGKLKQLIFYGGEGTRLDSIITQPGCIYVIVLHVNKK